MAGSCGGDIVKKVILYIHGKGGSHLEAEQYKKNCSGFDIIGIDYNDYLPWIVQNQIQLVYNEARERYDYIYVKEEKSPRILGKHYRGNTYALSEKTL